MPYLVLTDTALPTVPRSADAAIRKAGEVLDDDQVDPVTQGLLRDGDPHVRAILTPVTEDQAHQLRVGQIALEIFTDRVHERDAEDAEDRRVDTTPATALRWAAQNPGDIEHISEIEGRLESLERHVADLESRDDTTAGAA